MMSSGQLQPSASNTHDVRKKKGGFFLEVIKFSLIAVIIVIPIRFFVAQPFIVNGASMDPTFASGQYLIIDEFTYRFIEEPERGEVIVFTFPNDKKKFFIKRIIGLPGETIHIDHNAVTITNAEYPDGATLDEPYIANGITGTNRASVTLDNTEYFVMGDNRSASFDSREWGPLQEDMIVGRALVRLFPLQSIGFFPGTYRSSISD